jgi:hypothetical protein
VPRPRASGNAHFAWPETGKPFLFASWPHIWEPSGVLAGVGATPKTFMCGLAEESRIRTFTACFVSYVQVRQAMPGIRNMAKIA